LRHLINGNAHLCFNDESYFPNGRNPSLVLAPEKILMIDRIISVDPNGGPYGLGEIIAEKDLAPDDWYFPCHFRDDEVLAGSLQAEGGASLMSFYAMYLGLQRLMKDARFQPMYDIPQKVRCRKEVVPHKDTKLIYRLIIRDINLTPHPYIIGDLEIISNDLITVHFENLGIQLREKSNPKYLEKKEDEKPVGILLNEKDISIFALGRLSDSFGSDFSIYDKRTSSRQPNSDLQFISRIIKIEGKRQDFSKPSTIWSEYDIPKNVWYYKQNSSNTMPYSIIMEIALQPCGLLGAYLGSTLKFPDKDLYFRNLDGDGELFAHPLITDFRGKTIKNKAILISSVAFGDTIIQQYSFELTVDNKLFYKGSASFGFFTGEALAQQVGLDSGKYVEPWYKLQGLLARDYFRFKLDSLYAKMKLYKSEPDKPYFHLAENQLDLLDTGLIVKEGGEFGKGYIYSTKFVKTYDWYFTCHFYQDPVMPGSLGVEAIIQAMQVYAMQQNLGSGFKSPRFIQVENHKTKWKYRGQILKNVREMALEAHIKSLKKKDKTLILVANAYLWNENTRIYHISDVALGISESN